MAKCKPQKPLCVPQKHLHSRISFLYQAATYLASTQSAVVTSTPSDGVSLKPVGVSNGSDLRSKEVKSSTSEQATTSMASVPVRDRGVSHSDWPASSMRESAPSRQLLSHLHAVSRKAQISLSPNIKHSVCKRCHTLLITGSNCHERLENLSRGSRKPWADVMVRKCLTCGTEKRTPTGIMRQAGKAKRCTMKKSLHQANGQGEIRTGADGPTPGNHSDHT